MKPRLFLGSSGESIAILEKVKLLFEEICECTMWTNAFKKNRSNLESLIVQTKMSDYSILVATKDDLLLERDELYQVARDNVILEFGLFLGSCGINRAFLLAEDKISLPSDLDGITIGNFTLETGKHNSLEKVCEDIKQSIIKNEEVSALGLLPSTALAIGYYYSFIKNVCDDIHANGIVKTGDPKNPVQLKVKNFEIRVIIPEELDDNGVEDFKVFYSKKHDLKAASSEAAIATKRGYPFAFKIEPPEQDQNGDLDILICDIPTTLNTINHTIRLHMPPENLGKDSGIEYLEKRELNNFAKALRYLISKNVSTRNNVVVSENVKVDK